MKILLLLIIKLYWFVFPKDKRRKCIFKISCSRYVYQKTKEDGLIEGLLALKYRFLTCRGGYHIYEHPVTNCKMMLLSNFQIISESEISERIIKISNKTK